MNSELFQLPASDEVAAISLWQPWAQWVILGWKTIETRLHPRFAGLAGKRIAIHAARVWDVNALTAAERYLPVKQIGITGGWWKADRLTGVILGTVQVLDHRQLKEEDSKSALIECRTPRFGLILSEPEMFHHTIPAKGLQGIWKVRLPAK